MKLDALDQQARLAAVERRLRPLVENTPLVVVEWDAELRITRWSGRAAAVFGWTTQEALGRGLEALGLGDEDAARFRAAFERLRRGEIGSLALEARNQTRAGETRSCEWHLSALHDDEQGPPAVLGLGLDVTDRERFEAGRREAARHNDEFLGTLAHELRNPLAPIRNALEIMRLAGHDSGAAERARALIERQLGQVVRLIDDLLDVSRLSLGRLELRRERLDLAAVVQEAVAASRPIVESSGHRLAVSTPPSPVYVEGDRERLVQVLTNLLSNASRYMEAGGNIRLAVEREQGAAAIRVQDEGVGIPAEMMPYVFSMFTQGSRFGHRSDSGLGMGLTLVRQLVERHGGSVEARSEGPGCGSEFVVRLPAAAAPAPREERAPARASAKAPRRRILVVDDNVDAATSLATMLRMMGHETLTAHDGLSALEAAATSRPEVVLLDIGMPGMSGYEVATRIRGSAWGEGMALIALTGWGQEEDRKRSREAGFDQHLVKPVNPEMLAGVLAVLPQA